MVGVSIIYTVFYGDLRKHPLCYACNMGKEDLPDMYAQARGHAAPEGECGHIRQIPTAHVT